MEYRNEHDQYEAEAYEMGVEAGRAAASWAVDGNSNQHHIRQMLVMFEEGDPALHDYLPTYPDLSGEWADAPTPQSLAQDIMGPDYRTDDPMVEALADAWERGVAEVYLDACESEYRKAVA